jgi:signal transduction histidine kinase
MSRTSDRRADVQVAAAACLGGAVVTWACAWVVRRQHQLVVELRQAQDALAAGAAAEERARIAREVHDVIAHSLTVTLLHVSAARLAVQDRPEDAVAALAEAERLGRRSLADVRRAVGLLGPALEGGATAPLPSAADIPALVAEYRAAGMRTGLAVTGDVDVLSSATSLALYRIAEESLANAARHAPGAPVEVELKVEVEGGRAVLRIVNGAGTPEPTPVVSPRAGLGLSGIRQRTELIGGSLQEGPIGTGWRVEVEVPLDGDAL